MVWVKKKVNERGIKGKKDEEVEENEEPLKLQNIIYEY